MAVNVNLNAKPRPNANVSVQPTPVVPEFKIPSIPSVPSIPTVLPLPPLNTDFNQAPEPEMPRPEPPVVTPQISADQSTPRIPDTGWITKSGVPMKGAVTAQAETLKPESVKIEIPAALAGAGSAGVSQIGKPGVGVIPGEGVTNIDGENFDMPERADEDEEIPVTTPAPAPKKKPAVDDLQRAVEAATAANNGEQPTQKQVNTQMNNIAAERRGDQKVADKAQKANERRAGKKPSSGLLRLESIASAKSATDVAQQTLALLDDLLSKKVTARQITDELSGQNKLKPTASGKIGLDTVYAFARGMLSGSESAIPLLRDAVMEFRKISNDAWANQLAQRIAERMQNVANRQKFLDAVKAALGTSVTDSESETTTEDLTETDVGFTLTRKGQYTAKDQKKASQATKYIGRGSEGSATQDYAADAGDKANTGSYDADDVVFVSAEGRRANRIDPDFDEIQLAMDAGATILTDSMTTGRQRAHNVGEKQVAKYLTENGYVETPPGHWEATPNPQTAKAEAPTTPGMITTPGVETFKPVEDFVEGPTPTDHENRMVNDDGSLTKEGWAAQDAYAVGLGLTGNGVDVVAEAAQNTPPGMITTPGFATFLLEEVEEGVLGFPDAEDPEQAAAIAEAILNREEMDPVEEAEIAQEFANERVSKLIKPEAADEGGEGGAPPGGTPPGKGGFHPQRPPKKPKAAMPVLSEAFKRIVQARKWIKEMLDNAEFRLSGDYDEMEPVTDEKGVVQKTKTGKVKKHNVTYHSGAVMGEIKETFKFFGIEYDPEQIVWLFRAFQVYRGFSVDRSNSIFNKKPKDIQISDEQFIEFLKEIRDNVRKKNHPFAYTNPYYDKVGGNECYPLPTTQGLAMWFTQTLPADGNALAMSEDEFVAYSMNQHENNVRPRMLKYAAKNQREALFDMIDVIAEEWDGDSRATIKPREVNSRVSANEMYDANSKFARGRFDTDEEAERELSLLLVQQQEAADRAMATMEKQEKYRPKRKPKNKKKVDDEAINWIDAGVNRLSELNGYKAVKFVSNIARTMPLVAMVPLTLTNSAEHGVGIGFQSIGQAGLNMFAGTNKKNQGSEDFAADLTRDENMYAFERLLGLWAGGGIEAIIDAAQHGLKFTVKSNDAGSVEKFREWVVKMSIGDSIFKKSVMKVFMHNLVYQFERSETLAKKQRERDTKKGRPPSAPIIRTTAADLEGMLAQNPDAFWSMVALSKEGRAALHYAADTSLAGTDPMTTALRKAVSDPIVDFLVGYIAGWYLKFGVRSWLRMIPFSVTMMYIVKKAGINNARLGVAWVKEQAGDKEAMKRARAVNTDTNETLLGGNERFMDGLGQVLTVDMARGLTQIGVYGLAMGVVWALGGIAPPDDDEEEGDKSHLYYEYKIGADRDTGKGGVAIKDAWYFMELMGFAMPFVVATNIAMSGDTQKAVEVLQHGLMAELEEGTWMNVADTLDLITNYDRYLAQAEEESQGYLNEEKVSTLKYSQAMLLTFMQRRAYQSFEPAMFRALMNEAGTDAGRENLAHSVNRVFTSDTTDDPSAVSYDPVSYQEKMERRTAYSSPTMGFLLNLFSGYYVDNGTQKTGHLRDEMPLIVNSDAFQSEIIRDYLLYDEDGVKKPWSKWIDAEGRLTGEARSKGARVLQDVASDAPYQLAADGVAIPYEARQAATAILDEEWVRLETDFDAREDAGEFWSSVNGLSYEESATRKNKAYQEKEAAKKALDKKADLVWSDEIPFSAIDMNRWETSFSPLYVWNENSATPGAPATKWDWRWHRDEVTFSVYASGDHKSSLWPFSYVDDMGKDTFDARTQAPWQTKDTKMENVRRRGEGNIITEGIGRGEDLFSVYTGGGAIGGSQTGDYDNTKLVGPSRAMQKAETKRVEVKDEDRYLGQNYVSPATKAKTSSGGWGSGWGSGGGGGFSPNIYSKPGYSLNSDKAAGLYSKIPTFTRFDYLRPKVFTKGSREAYRREDY